MLLKMLGTKLLNKVLGKKEDKSKRRRRIIILILVILVFIVLTMSVISKLRLLNQMTEITAAVISLFTTENEGEEDEDNFLEWRWVEDENGELKWTKGSDSSDSSCYCTVASCPNKVAGDSSGWGTGGTGGTGSTGTTYTGSGGIRFVELSNGKVEVYYPDEVKVSFGDGSGQGVFILRPNSRWYATQGVAGGSTTASDSQGVYYLGVIGEGLSRLLIPDDNSSVQGGTFRREMMEVHLVHKTTGVEKVIRVKDSPTAKAHTFNYFPHSILLNRSGHNHAAYKTYIQGLTNGVWTTGGQTFNWPNKGSFEIKAEILPGFMQTGIMWPNRAIAAKWVSGVGQLNSNGTGEGPFTPGHMDGSVIEWKHGPPSGFSPSDYNLVKIVTPGPLADELRNLSTGNTTSTPNTSGTVSGSTNAEKIWNYFVTANIAGVSNNPAVIAGIMGNLQQESSLDPFKVTGSYYGLFQTDALELQNLIIDAGLESYWGNSNAPSDAKDKAIKIMLDYLQTYPRWTGTSGGVGESVAFMKHLDKPQDKTSPRSYAELFMVSVEGAIGGSDRLVDLGVEEVAKLGDASWYQNTWQEMELRRNYAEGFYNQFRYAQGGLTTDPPIGITPEVCTSCKCVQGSGTGAGSGGLWNGKKVEHVSNAEVFAHIGFDRNNPIKVYDLATGTTFNVRLFGFSANYHLDWDPFSVADDIIIRSLTPSDPYNWGIRPSVIEFNGRYFMSVFHTNPHHMGSWPQTNSNSWNVKAYLGGYAARGEGHACLHFQSNPVLTGSDSSSYANEIRSKLASGWEQVQNEMTFSPGGTVVPGVPGVPQSGIWADTNAMMAAINAISDNQNKNAALAFAPHVGKASTATQRNSLVNNHNNVQVWSQNGHREEWGSLQSRGVAADMHAAGCTIMSTASAVSSIIGRTVNPPEIVIIAHTKGWDLSPLKDRSGNVTCYVLGDGTIKNIVRLILDANGFSGKYTIKEGKNEDNAIEALESGGRVIFRYDRWGHFSTLRSTVVENGVRKFYRADSAGGNNGHDYNNVAATYEQIFSTLSGNPDSNNPKQFAIVLTN